MSSTGTALTEREGGYLLSLRGVASFVFIPTIDKHLSSIPEGEDVTIDLRDPELIDVIVIDTRDGHAPRLSKTSWRPRRDG